MQVQKESGKAVGNAVDVGYKTVESALFAETSPNLVALERRDNAA